MQFDSTTINMLIKGIGDTFYMVLLSSALSYIIGIPLGIALVVTDKDGISPVPVFNRVLGVVINLSLIHISFIWCTGKRYTGSRDTQAGCPWDGGLRPGRKDIQPGCLRPGHTDGTAGKQQSCPS